VSKKVSNISNKIFQIILCRALFGSLYRVSLETTLDVYMFSVT